MNKNTRFMVMEEDDHFQIRDTKSILPNLKVHSSREDVTEYVNFINLLESKCFELTEENDELETDVVCLEFKLKEMKKGYDKAIHKIADKHIESVELYLELNESKSRNDIIKKGVKRELIL